MLIACAGKLKFDTQVAFLDSETAVVTHILFHPYEPVVVTCNGADLVSYVV